MKFISVLVMLFALCACVVGPDYRAPEISTSTAFSELHSDAADVHYDRSEPTLKWWERFEDELLNDLIEQAAQQNLSLDVAAQRIMEARSGLQNRRSDYFPQIQTGVSAARSSVSANSASPLAALVGQGVGDLQISSYDLGLSTSWELDVFGRIARQTEAGEAWLSAALNGYEHTRLMVAGEVAVHYFTLRGLQARLAIAHKNILIQEQTLALVRRKYKAGLVSELDVARAKANLNASIARLPGLRTGIKQSIFRLSVISGRPPVFLQSRLIEAKALPTLPASVSLGSPATLISRRPDIRMAEKTLAARSAEVGVATARLYPSFSVNSLLALSSLSTGNLVSGESEAWSLAAGLQWPAFTGGRLSAEVRAADARFSSAYAQFKQAVLHALEDVELNLVAFNEEQRRSVSLNETVLATKRSVDLAKVLYDKGLSDFLVVLDAERSLVEIEDRHIESETQKYVQLVMLYKALGGGWPQGTYPADRVTADNSGATR